MDLHHEPVVEAHARHLGQHLRAEEFGILRRRRARRARAGTGPRLRAAEVGGARAGMAVVGRRRAHAPEELAAARGAPRGSRPTSRVSSPVSEASSPMPSRKPGNSGSTTGSGRYAVSTRPFQPLAQQRIVVRQLVERRLGRRQHLDVEALEQGPGPELGSLQAGADVVVVSRPRSPPTSGTRGRRHPRTPGRATSRTAYRGTGGSGGRAGARLPADRCRCPVRRRPVCRATSIGTPWL